MIDLADEERRRQDLRRFKAIPLALLAASAVLMAIGWWQSAQPDASAAWGFVRAAGEAGLVGGLADWFAVTALFRRPLGLPIPHTAIIPTKKDQLGASLGTFVRSNFLDPEAVRERVVSADPAMRLGTYLQVPAHRDRVIGEASALSTTAIESIDDASAQLIIRNLIFQHAAAYAWAPPAGQLLGAIVEDHSHDAAVDVVFRVLQEWVEDNEAAIVTLIADRGPAQGFFLARAAHEAVGRRVYAEVLRWVGECRTDPTCATRLAIDDWLAQAATRLREDPETIAKVELFKQRVLASAETHEAVASIWPSVKRVVLASLADPDSELRRRAGEYLDSTTERLIHDEPFRSHVNGRIGDATAFLVSRYGDEAAHLISDTVARWDGGEAARRIELQVGRDLQYIRVNGTIVGALAGVAIHAIGLTLIG